MNNKSSQFGCLLAIIQLPFSLLRFFIGYSIIVFIRLPLIFIDAVCQIFLRGNRLTAGIFEFDEEYLEKINKWMWNKTDTEK